MALTLEGLSTTILLNPEGTGTVVLSTDPRGPMLTIIDRDQRYDYGYNDVEIRQIPRGHGTSLKFSLFGRNKRTYDITDTGKVVAVHEPATETFKTFANADDFLLYYNEHIRPNVPLQQ